MTCSIVFDFDGTLAIGHGPVLAYARAVAPLAKDNFVERVEDELRAYDAGEASYRDGYHVVAEVAAQDGVPSEAMNQAYQQSRTVLGTPEAPIDAPDGLIEILDALRGLATLHVATNAPAIGVEQILESWGARPYFDQLHTQVGKPDGLYPIVEQLLEQGPVLSVGDIYDFDLKPAHDLGADTVLVGATAQSSTVEVTMRGNTITDLRHDMLRWAARSS